MDNWSNMDRVYSISMLEKERISGLIHFCKSQSNDRLPWLKAKQPRRTKAMMRIDFIVMNLACFVSESKECAMGRQIEVSSYISSRERVMKRICFPLFHCRFRLFSDAGERARGNEYKIHSILRSVSSNSVKWREKEEKIGWWWWRRSIGTKSGRRENE